MSPVRLLTRQLEWNTIVDKVLLHSVVTLGYLLSNVPKRSLWGSVSDVSNEHIYELPVVNKLILLYLLLV